MDNTLGDMMASSTHSKEDNSPADASDRETKEEEPRSSSINRKGFMRLPGDSCLCECICHPLFFLHKESSWHMSDFAQIKNSDVLDVADVVEALADESRTLKWDSHNKW